MEQNPKTIDYTAILGESKAAMILYENYIGTQLYADIVEYTDNKFPEWRTKKELGKFAPLFILFILDYQLEHLIEGTLEEFLRREHLVFHFQYQAYKQANRTHNWRDMRPIFKQYIIENPPENPPMELDEAWEYAKDFIEFDNSIIYWPY